MANQRILLVEDEPLVRDMLALTLSGEGYDVKVAGNFAEAMACLDSEPYALAISDWRLPDGDGLLIADTAADDWTPAAPCEKLAASAKSAGEPVSIVLYPGAYHDFDYPDMPVHTREGLAYTADGSGTAHSGTDPAARQDAVNRVIEFLAQ
jgi:CheY-like chemotaxis protein